MPEGGVDEYEVEDDGTGGVGGVSEDVHLLGVLRVPHTHVHGREGSAIELGPLLCE